MFFASGIALAVAVFFTSVAVAIVVIVIATRIAAGKLGGSSAVKRIANTSKRRMAGQTIAIVSGITATAS